MANKLTHEEFLHNVKTLHPVLYSQLTIVGDYKTSRSNILVNTKYGMCNPKAKSLLGGDFPSILSAIDKTDYYINKCSEIHGSQYDYSKTNYVSNKVRVVITCKEHGDFNPYASEHLDGKGCRECSKKYGISVRKNKRITIRSYNHESFMIKFEKNKYMYSRIIFKENFKGLDKKVLISTKYGDCIVKPSSLLKRKSFDSMIRSAVNKTEFFINRCKEVHGDRYDYSETVYNGSQNNVVVICKSHGPFNPQAAHHLMGSNCKQCCNEQSAIRGIYQTMAFKNRANWKNINATLYVLKCWSLTESFYKIGITKQKLSRRFGYKASLPYSYEILHVFTSNLQNVVNVEKQLHKIHSIYKYFPNIKFGGYTECFYSIDETKIKEVTSAWNK